MDMICEKGTKTHGMHFVDLGLVGVIERASVSGGEGDRSSADEEMQAVGAPPTPDTPTIELAASNDPPSDDDEGDSEHLLCDQMPQVIEVYRKGHCFAEGTLIDPVHRHRKR